eukprot:NODE_28060_length_491_cov_1.456044.p1 GENE.NODE_28060_length_491_cov_1.456044~~NODE_28060_length_491_cov_1.456044.p1  ORF type:complete len:150 (+),score=38.21 NODE_28060_length_491_cov_1.456044:60-452(+)
MATRSAARCLAVAGFLGGHGVIASAYGAHGLSKHVPDVEAQNLWKLAGQYQMMHAAAIIAAAGLPPPVCTVSSTLFATGTIMFSGSLYGLALLPRGDMRRSVLGPITPIGGVALTAGWLSLTLPLLRRRF